jgi:hypothetical protein
MSPLHSQRHFGAAADIVPFPIAVILFQFLQEIAPKKNESGWHAGPANNSVFTC